MILRPSAQKPSPRALLWAWFLLLAVVGAGCGDSLGKVCDSDGDCDDGNFVCAPRTVCAPGAMNCTGICTDPCETDEDCRSLGKNWRCVGFADGNTYCRNRSEAFD